MRIIRNLMAFTAVAGGTILLASAASAESLLPKFIGEVNLGGGLYQYNYQVQLAGTDSQLITGTSFFTVYDFNGMTAATVTATNGTGIWTPTIQPVGLNPFGTSVPDGAANNVTFTYAGPTQSQPTTVNPVFKFEITSTLGTLQTTPATFYAGQDFDSSIPFIEGNQGVMKGAAAVPELGTLPLLGGMLGLGGLGLFRRRSSK